MLFFLIPNQPNFPTAISFTTGYQSFLRYPCGRKIIYFLTFILVYEIWKSLHCFYLHFTHTLTFFWNSYSKNLKENKM